MDLIIAVCRTLASRPRLHLLRALYAQPGITVNALAEAVKLPPFSASHHLKLLGSFPFIEAVPSGRQVHYRPAAADHISNNFLRDVQQLLQGVFAARQQAAAEPAQPVTHGAEQDEVLMKLFTTYTHLRRLLILRHLALNGACTAAELEQRIGMSPAAMARHLDKLLRRGLVSVAGDAPPTWDLAPLPKPGLCRSLRVVILHKLKLQKP
jgi:DNA-binding transcriptional ArsR family regulator